MSQMLRSVLVKRRGISLLALIIAGLLLPSDSRACGFCVDMQMLPAFPFAPWLIPLIWFWITAITIVKWATRRHSTAPATVPAWKTVLFFFLLSTVGIVVLSLLTNGGFLYPFLMIGATWVVYVIGSVGKLLCTCPLTSMERACKWVHVTGLFLLVAVLLFTVYQEHSLSTMIPRMSTAFGARQIYVERVIRRSGSAIAPLIKALDDLLRPPGGIALDDWQTQKIRPLVYCLGQIATPEAEAYLRASVQQMLLATNGNSEVQKWICGAYASCAGEKAVHDFATLYQHEQQHATNSQWLILVSMVKTASWPGVQFALDHVAPLWACAVAGMSGCDRQLAFETLQRLYSCSGRESLRHILLFQEEYGHAGGVDSNNLFFKWGPLPDPSSPRSAGVDPRLTWQAHADEIHTYWEQALHPSAGSRPAASRPLP